MPPGKQTRSRIARKEGTSLALAAAAAVLWAGSAPAAVVTWDGGNANGADWESPNNWSTNTVPADFDDVVFATAFTSGTTIHLNGEREVNNLTINTTTAFTLNARTYHEFVFGEVVERLATLKVTGDITRSDLAGTEQTHTIRVPIVLIGDTVINVAGSGALVLDYGVHQESVLFPYGITKTGPGNLIINDNFDHDLYEFEHWEYRGATNVNQGALQTGMTLVGPVTVASGATLLLDNGTVDGVLTAGGHGISFFGSNLGALTGSGTVKGLTLTEATTSTVLEGGHIRVAGPLTSTAGRRLTKDGPGIFSLQAASTAFAGGMEVRSGVVRLSANNAASTGGTTVLAGAALELRGLSDTETFQSTQSSSRALTLNGAGPAGLGALFSQAQIVPSPNVTQPGANTWAGPITLATDSSIGVGGISTLVLSGVVSGPGALTKLGTGELALGAANTFTGAVTVNQGTLSLTSAQALPAATPQVTVAAGGALALADGGAYAQPLRLSGTGAQGSSALILNRSGQASATWSGPIDLLADASVYVDESDSLTLSGRVGGAFALTKNGRGVMTLANANNAFSSLVVADGVAKVTLPAAVPSGGVTVNSGGTLLLAPSATAYTRPLSLSGSGYFISTSGQSAGALRALDAGSYTWSGAVQLAANSTVRVDADASLVLSGVVSGPGRLTKTGAGTLRLNSTSNSYAGGTAVSEGVLRLLSAALPDQAGAAPLTVADGAALELSGAFTQSGVTLNLAGAGVAGNGALDSTGGTPTWAGPVTLTSNASIGVDAGTLTLSGAVSGATALLKVGPGTLSLTAANTYTGATTIKGGALSVNSDAALGTSPIVTLENASKLTFTTSATTSRRFALSGGSLQVSSAQTLTYDDASVTNGFLRGPGTHAIAPGTLIGNVTALAGTKLTVASGTLTNFSSAGEMEVTGTATWDGGQNDSPGILNIGAAATFGRLFTNSFHNNGIINISPANSELNTSNADLASGGGSRITVNAGGRIVLGAGELDLHGALLVNNGTITAAAVNVYYGSLAAGTGTFPTAVNVHPGGRYTPGATLANAPAPGPLSTALIAPLDPGVTAAAPVTLFADTTVDVTTQQGTLTLTAGITGDGHTLTKTGGGVLALGRLRAAALDLREGTVTMLPGGAGVNVLNTLSIAGDDRPAATLDLADQDLVVHQGDLKLLTALVRAGRDGGAWRGSGLTSSAAAGDRRGITALAVIQNESAGRPIHSSFAGEPVTPDAILIKYTYSGDTDLDGLVAADDFARADRGFLTRRDTNPANDLHGWLNGDFNYDNRIDISDYFQIDRAMAMQGAPLGRGPAMTAAAAAVPEPGGLGAVVLLGGSALTRRRRR